MPTMLDAALAYASRGIAVFPCKPQSKQPACANGFHDATVDPARITAWWTENPDYNLASCPHQQNESVVDLDGPEGIAAWKQAETEHGGHVATQTVRTPRGGLHLRFKGELPPSVRKLVPGAPIDTRGRGSYVLLPPSRTPDGEYVLVYDREPAPVPQWVADWAASRKKQATHLDAPVDADQPHAIAAAIDWLERQPGSKLGAGSNQQTYRLFCALRDLGISPEKGLELMLAHWNPRCDPPWPEERLRTYPSPWMNAYSYAENDFGAKADQIPSGSVAERFGATVELPAPLADERFDAILASKVEPVEELIHGLVERGLTTFLAGPGGTHKSRLGLQWGLSLQAAMPVIMGRKAKPATFVYLSYEDPRREVVRRTQAMAKQLELDKEAIAGARFLNLRNSDLGPIAEVDETGVNPTSFHDLLIDYLQKIPGPKFVVLDSAYNVLDFHGSAKIHEPSVKAAIALLDKICEDTDSTMLCLWHPSQAGQERGDASGWSVAWHNAPRAKLSISSVKDSDLFTLKVEKRNYAAKGEPLFLQWADGVLEVTEANKAAAIEMDAAVLAVVQECFEAQQRLWPVSQEPKWALQRVRDATERKVTWAQIGTTLTRLLKAQRVRKSSNPHGKTPSTYLPLDPAVPLA